MHIWAQKINIEMKYAMPNYAIKSQSNASQLVKKITPVPDKKYEVKDRTSVI